MPDSATNANLDFCYKTLFNFSPVGYLILNSDSTVLNINQTAADFLTTQKSKILNQKFLSFICPDDQTAFIHYLHKLTNHHPHQQ